MDYVHKISPKLLRSKLFFALEILISAVLGIAFVLPILGSLLILNEVLRLCYKLYLKLVYEDSIQLNYDECGSNYLYMPTEGRRTILYLGEVEGTVKVETVRENYQKHIVENKVYSRLMCTFQKWMYPSLKKCDTFDIRNHVRYYPGTEDRIVSEKELLKTILPDLGKDMTDLEKPQWEEVIIPFYEASQSSSQGKVEQCRTKSESSKTISLRIIRIHHSYMDGASTLLMIANTMSGEQDSFPYVINPCKPLKISKLSMFLYKLTSLALFTSAMLRNLLMPPILRQTRFNVDCNSLGETLFGWTKKIPIDKFQKIKEKSGASMPSIVSTVLTSAIRSLDLKYPVLNNEVTLETPRVPDLHPLWVVAGMFPYEADMPGNEHIVIETQANTSDISSCERLSIMNDDLGRLAKNPMVTVYYWFAKLLGRFPRPFAAFFLSLTACPAILSNIPLCTRNVKLWGKECYSIVGWVPLLARTGLGVVSVRYGDHFRYCIQADSSVVNEEELDFFVHQIEDQVEQLLLETAQLKRRISTESSVFDHDEKEKQITRLSADSHFELKTKNIKDFENDNSIDDHGKFINNNNRKNVDETLDKRVAIKSANHSFIFKLKDNIEQIREGIKKIKEQ